MTAPEFENLIVAWARSQPDIQALIQIGSRVQVGGHVDEWSDWDFHVISSRPQKYYSTDWVAEIAPVWCVNVERSIRGRIKVTAIFDKGLEVDFVPLVAWQMKLVYWGMRHPGRAAWMPKLLVRGIQETRTILLNSGYRVWIGGERWERRLTALSVAWPSRRMCLEEFNRHTAAFWQKAVWVTKKIARPEPRSAMHWLHRLVLEHVYCMLEEEAWLAGRSGRPEALKAEKWLDSKRLQQTSIETSVDPKKIAAALLREIALFEEVCASVAASRGFSLPDYTAVASWLRVELAKLAG